LGAAFFVSILNYGMPRFVKPRHKPAILSLRDFYNLRNKVLIYRNLGGLGDILMHRMMFEDFKNINPEMKLIFACPPQYHDAVKDHPYIDEVLDCNHVVMSDYVMAYNTSSACTRHEIAAAPLSDKHRSDIWANHCGVELQNHNMHIRLSEDELDYGRKWVKKINTEDKPTVVFCPISAMRSKNLQPFQMTGIVKGLREMGYFVYSIHNTPIPELEELNVPVIFGQKTRQWMGIIMAADYALTVDTAAFHFAGGMGKPLTGVFTWADGKVYGKYFDFVLVQKHRDNGDWPCGPCYTWLHCPLSKDRLKPCLTKISPEMVLDGCRKMFAKWPKITT
jgi:hypothetical protein